MGHYSDKRINQSFRFWSEMSGSTTVADNYDAYSILIPANKEVEIYKLSCFTVATNTTANGKIELVDASNNILMSVTNTHTNATLANQSQTAPVTFKNGSTDTVLKLRTDQTIAAAKSFIVHVNMTDPGVA